MLPVYRTSWANEAFLDTTTIEVNPPQPLHKGGGGGTPPHTHTEPKGLHLFTPKLILVFKFSFPSNLFLLPGMVLINHGLC